MLILIVLMPSNQFRIADFRVKGGGNASNFGVPIDNDNTLAQFAHGDLERASNLFAFAVDKSVQMCVAPTTCLAAQARSPSFC